MLSPLKSLIDIPAQSFVNWIGSVLSSSLLWFINRSYWILLIWAMVALLFAIVGNTNSRKHISLSMLTYFLLECLKVVMF